MTKREEILVIEEYLDKCNKDKFTGSIRIEVHFRDGGICNGSIERKEALNVKKNK